MCFRTSICISTLYRNYSDNTVDPSCKYNSFELSRREEEKKSQNNNVNDVLRPAGRSIPSPQSIHSETCDALTFSYDMFALQVNIKKRKEQTQIVEFVLKHLFSRMQHWSKLEQTVHYTFSNVKGSFCLTLVITVPKELHANCAEWSPLSGCVISKFYFSSCHRALWSRSTQGLWTLTSFELFQSTAITLRSFCCCFMVDKRLVNLIGRWCSWGGLSCGI